jgi:hypothetical protein
MVNCRPRVTRCVPRYGFKVTQPDEYDILVVNKFVLGLLLAPALLKLKIERVKIDSALGFIEC